MPSTSKCCCAYRGKERRLKAVNLDSATDEDQCLARHQYWSGIAIARLTRVRRGLKALCQ